MTTPRAFALSILLIALLAAPSPAQVHPTAQKGFAADKAFQIGDVDHVNLFNGNLVLTIPVGQEYSTEGGFSYRLALHYNSKVWDYEEDQFGQGLTQALPSGTSNAGLGWILSLGQVLKSTNPDNETFDQLSYVSPDGGQHAFYDTLHLGEAAVGGRQYTRDGTYIRLQGLYENGTQVWLDFPNGQRHIFDDVGDSYRLVRIEDKFGNGLDIDYPSASHWVLSDGFRTHDVFFTSSAYFPRKLDRIELAKPGGGPAATWSFSYQNVQISRGCPDNDPQTVDVLVPLLTRIIQPDGSFWDMPASTSYHLDSGVSCSDLAGRIKGIRLPTGGRIDWTYRTYVQTAGCEGKVRDWLKGSVGIGSRTVSSGQVSGTWTYTSRLIFQPIIGGASCNPPRTQITTVTTPLGDVEQNYFSVYRAGPPGEPNPDGWKLSEFGLPFTRKDTNGVPPFLSREVFDSCDPDVSVCVPERSMYVRYEQDADPGDNGVGSIFNVDSRLAQQETRTEGGSKIASVLYSSFDGFGHYRTEVLGGNFPGTTNTKTTFTNYNPESGTYNHLGGGTFQMRGPNDPWVLATYTEMISGEGSSSKTKTQTCFERDVSGKAITPFLLRKRIFLDEFGTTPNSRDLVMVYQRDGKGNLIREDSYGGDKVPLNTAVDLCTAAYVSPQYGMIVQPANASTGWTRTASPTTAAGGAMTFKTLDETIDPSSGLVVSSRDAAGLQTTYAYDAMSRPLTASPAQEAQTVYTFTVPTTAQPNLTPAIRVERKNGAVQLSESQLEFDGLGRVWREKRRIPGQGLQIQETTYDGMGHTASVSELGTISKTTRSTDYDPEGRPGKITLPDGKETTFQYFGDRSRVRFTSIGTTLSGTNVTETTARVDELYNRFGRLHSVTEPSGAGGGGVTTTYKYDSAGRLSEVRTPSGAVQVRTFTYDQRGFLLSESHLEKVGAVTYSGYDARGHVGQKVDGGRTLGYTYDRAERMTELREISSANRLLKQLGYAGPGDPCGACNSKLRQASRFNYVTLGATPFTVEVREIYEYNGVQGRPSKRTTENRTNGATNPSEAFVLSGTYTPLGNPATISYPQCQQTSCTNPAPRTVTFGYGDGFLTSIANYAPTISYHVNGMVNQVVHQNSSTVTVTDTIGLDPDGMVRPASISSARSATSLWNSGTYTYDGVGNIKKIGPSIFTYDAVSRLTYGSVNVNQGPTNPLLQTQEYAFDAFGNIQAIKTNGSTVNTPTDAATNRLSAPAAYDAAGNLTNWQGNLYEWDALNMMHGYKTAAGEEWTYVYTADDERFWSYKTGGTESRWTVRGLDDKVLREYNATAGWQVANDYVYRGDQLLAAETPSGVRHFHLDHLGTPRLVTDAAGTKKAFHAYYPFGQEATSVAQDGERMKFTGHERDLANPAGDGDDLDYMHARYCSPVVGRFLSVDEHPGREASPQSWNRYMYSQGQPINFVDLAGYYRTDFHLRLTQVIAYAAGYSASQSAAIAAADQAVDSGTSSPFSSTEARRNFHFTSPERRAALYRAAASSRSSADIGIYLHALQDSYSHAGFGPRLGHLFAGTGPDITANDPGKALSAAQATFNSLLRLRGQPGSISFKAIEPLVQNYLRLPEDSTERGRILGQIVKKIDNAKRSAAVANAGADDLARGGCAYHGGCA